jgi:hypothetical protein
MDIFLTQCKLQRKFILSFDFKRNKMQSNPAHCFIAQGKG